MATASRGSDKVACTQCSLRHEVGQPSGNLQCALAIKNGVIPPTINLDHPDVECDLDYVPHTARQVDVNVAMSNSFGFGGHNATLIAAKFNG